MSDNFKDYEGGLKYAFSQAYGGKPSEWTAEVKPAQKGAAPLAEFKNAALGITLNVMDMGNDAQGSAQFTAQFGDKDDIMNMSIPQNWKHLKI